MRIDIQTACRLLQEKDNILILGHRKPDGDTLGSCFALLYALQALGKTARVENPDGFPDRYGFITGGYQPAAFAPAFIVTADIASPQLMGDFSKTYADKVDLCIDHHKSNSIAAAYTVLDVEAAATTQIVRHIIAGLGVALDRPMANALYTGLSTDTGCFKYTNVTPETHLIAAELIAAGADHASINRLMFDTKSKGRLEIEKTLLDTLEYYFDDQCAVITIDAAMPELHNVSDEELDGVSALPRGIEGVKVGVTIRERADGAQRISLRTNDGLDASRICAYFGGGGHTAAAGCTIHAACSEAKARLLEQVKKELELHSQ